MKCWCKILLLTLSILNNLSTEAHKELLIEVRYPATILLPDSISSILIVNNAINQPADYQNRAEILGTVQNISINADSICEYACLGTLDYLQADFSNPVNITMYPHNCPPSSSRSESLPTLSSEQIETLQKQHGCDAILSLDQLLMSSLLQIKRSESGMPEGKFIVKAQGRFTLFLQDDKLPKHYNINDTLNWETDYSYGDWDHISGYPDHEINHILRQLPIGRDAMHEASYIIGEKFARRLTGYWEQQVRTIYTNSNGSLKEAAVMAEQSHWEEASLLWKEVFTQSGGTSRAYAAINLALYYELENQLDEAIHWAQEAIILLQQCRSKDRDKLQKWREYVSILQNYPIKTNKLT